MQKAYDRVSWQFLFQVLQKMGFDKHWCKWIKACILGAWFSVIINGSVSGFFPSMQGVRQGDPLSPALFIIMVEALSRTIKQHHLYEKWKGAKIEGTSISVMHSLFANDTLLFGSSLVSKAK